MYTRCPTTCSALTTALKAALRESGLQNGEYRVVSFSFDPDETTASLAAFRTRMQLPAEWITLRASDPAALDRTLRGLDFRTLQLEGGGIEHPNLVAVLDGSRHIVAFVYGIPPSPNQIMRAVRRARSGASLLDRLRPYLFLFAALGFVASSALFVFLVSHRHGRSGLPMSEQRGTLRPP
jgi:cytochrome oxidase Cu insertion factor (SCO1/SenC/PrrC family)